MIMHSFLNFLIERLMKQPNNLTCHLAFFFLTLFSFNINAELPLQLCNTQHIKDTKTYFVSLEGHDYKGDGSRLKPWQNITTTVNRIPDGSTVIVKKGIYVGSVKIKRKFDKGILIKSEYPYQAKLTNSQRVLAFVQNASNITLEGFEIYHNNKNAKPLVVHIDGGGSDKVNNITLKNNIIHDSFNNDLLKINHGASHINVYCNMFYNQGDSDEHIDINSVSNIKVRHNLFFNHFLDSQRSITKKSASYIVIKDSNGKKDKLLGASNIHIDSNIFFNWQGSHGHGFILIGEDGKPYYEANDIYIYNNLMLGNSPISMRSPLGIKGAKNIRFFNNTITGNLPSNAYAIRANTEAQNLINTHIYLYNNIWSDPTQTMGSGAYEQANDFSDTLHHQIDHFELNNNIIWNGEEILPYSFFDAINPNDDKNLHHRNPYLPEQKNILLPTWNNQKQSFNNGTFLITEAFQKIIYIYGISKYKLHKELIYKPDNFPSHNILGVQRLKGNAIGAINKN